ncbi:MAG: hypothetical protein LBE48_01630 [Methanomassiliicoccaceae archaeon]|jgi:hypothetical protein|nr:hypothetical protein [Methanomassiliicoccaceae archaeon]
MNDKEYEKVLQILMDPKASPEERIKATEKLQEITKKMQMDLRSQLEKNNVSESEQPREEYEIRDDKFDALEKEMMKKLESAMGKQQMSGAGGMPDMSKMMADMGMPDMSKMFAEGNTPDMSKMMESIKGMSGGGGMPDLSSMFSGGMPDMSKVMAAVGGMFGAAGVSDLSKMLPDGMPDMSKMFAGAGVPPGGITDVPDPKEILAIAEKYYYAHAWLVRGDAGNELNSKAPASFDGSTVDADRANILCDASVSSADDNYNVAAAAAAVGWAPTHLRSVRVLSSMLKQSPAVTDNDKMKDAEKMAQYAKALSEKKG